MELRLSQVIGSIKLSVIDTASKSDKRRLFSKEIVCKSGCAGCCSRPIEITVAEAVIMYDHLVNSKKWDEVKEIAKEQYKLLQDVKPLVWFKMNIKCAVLDRNTNNCLAYKVRPAKCSTHFVTSTPELCEAWSFNNSTYKSLDYDDLYVEFKERMSQQIEKYGVLSLELPIPAALLLAEKINTQSGLNVDQVISLIFNEL